MIHLRFFIYYYYRTYVGVCVTPLFFFLWRALCAVQSSCTVLFRCARPTHALHASSSFVLCTFVHHAVLTDMYTSLLFMASPTRAPLTPFLGPQVKYNVGGYVRAVVTVSTANWLIGDLWG